MRAAEVFRLWKRTVDQWTRCQPVGRYVGRGTPIAKHESGPLHQLYKFWSPPTPGGGRGKGPGGRRCGRGKKNSWRRGPPVGSWSADWHLETALGDCDSTPLIMCALYHMCTAQPGCTRESWWPFVCERWCTQRTTIVHGMCHRIVGLRARSQTRCVVCACVRAHNRAQDERARFPHGPAWCFPQSPQWVRDEG